MKYWLRNRAVMSLWKPHPDRACCYFAKEFTINKVSPTAPGVTEWNGKKYTFAMNGQTGKFVGDLPLDKGAFWKWLLGVSGAATAAAFAISYLMWLL